MAASHPAHDGQQKGDQRSPAPQNARRGLSQRLVHGTPDQACDRRQRSSRTRRRRKIRRSDETYVGGKARNRKGKTPKKVAVFSLVERGRRSRSFHVANVTATTLRPIIVSAASTDSHSAQTRAACIGPLARNLKRAALSFTLPRNMFEAMPTNTAEGYFSILKRGIYGVYHHVSEAHLHRYLAEFDFRYSNRIKLGIDDTERARRVIVGTGGKRLRYQRPTSEARA
jgi:hypothetical protein